MNTKCSIACLALLTACSGGPTASTPPSSTSDISTASSGAIEYYLPPGPIVFKNGKEDCEAIRSPAILGGILWCQCVGKFNTPKKTLTTADIIHYVKLENYGKSHSHTFIHPECGSTAYYSHEIE